MEILSFIWNDILVNPMTNLLIVLNNVLFGSFGLAIIVFTILMRVVTFPMTVRQLRSARALSAIQPRIQEIQKKYKDPKRRSEETMKLYRESGVNPLGCLAQYAIQAPIWFALYQVIRLALGSTPEALISLSGRLYPWDYIQHAVPLSDQFLFMDLSTANPILAGMVGIGMFVQQKVSTPPSTDERQASMSSTMMWMMPLMFTWFALSFPSGLALYWFVSSIVSIVLQQVYVGSRLTWRNLFSLEPVGAPRTATTPQRAAAPNEPEVEEEPLTAAEAAGDRRSKKRSRHGKRRRKR